MKLTMSTAIVTLGDIRKSLANWPDETPIEVVDILQEELTSLMLEEPGYTLIATAEARCDDVERIYLSVVSNKEAVE